MRQLLRRIEDHAAVALARGCQSLGSTTDNAVAILAYHRVVPDLGGSQRPTWSVTPDMLASQLVALLDAGMQPARLSELAASSESSAARFCVTFDDGYANTFFYAAPVLAALGVPATVFVSTAYLGSNQRLPFDDWSLAGSRVVPRTSWQAATLEQCREAVASGTLDIGGHTHTHADFRGDREAFRADIETSHAFLQFELGVHDPAFSFPFGSTQLGFVTDEMTDDVRSAGYSCALSCNNRRSSVTDPYRLDRLQIEAFDTPRSVVTKALPMYSQVRGRIDQATGTLRRSRLLARQPLSLKA